VRSVVLSGANKHVLSGARVSCYQAQRVSLSPCKNTRRGAPNSSNKKSFGFLLTAKRLWINRNPRAERVLGSLALGVVLLAAATLFHPPYRLIYNASPSAPLGWYVVRPARSVSVGARVLLWLPPGARMLADGRHYLPSSVPALKRIVAAAGDRVCEKAGIVTINGRVIARAKPIDHAGRRLVAWHGCKTLPATEIFLLNENDGSFDSRYFGPVDRRRLIGAAFAIWTW
jgi:conjugative transfer signal peptidase TraF